MTGEIATLNEEKTKIEVDTKEKREEITKQEGFVKEQKKRLTEAENVALTEAWENAAASEDVDANSYLYQSINQIKSQQKKISHMVAAVCRQSSSVEGALALSFDYMVINGLVEDRGLQEQALSILAANHGI